MGGGVQAAHKFVVLVLGHLAFRRRWQGSKLLTRGGVSEHVLVLEEQPVHEVEFVVRDVDETVAILRVDRVSGS